MDNEEMENKQKKINISQFDIFTGEQKTSNDDIAKLIEKLGKSIIDSNSAATSKKRCPIAYLPFRNF